MPTDPLLNGHPPEAEPTPEPLPVQTPPAAPRPAFLVRPTMLPPDIIAAACAVTQQLYGQDPDKVILVLESGDEVCLPCLPREGHALPPATATAAVTATVPMLPSMLPPEYTEIPHSRYSDECLRAVVGILLNADRRVVGHELEAALARQWGGSTVRHTLSEGVKAGVLTSGNDLRGRGYGLPSWKVAS